MFPRFRSRDSKRHVSILVLCALLLAVVAPVLAMSPGAPAAGNSRPVKGQQNVQSTFNDSKFTASDIDADGQDEILAGNSNGVMYCFTGNGQGIKWQAYVGATIRGSAACYDVDGDGRKEVFFGDMAGRVWGLNSGGGVLSQWGWPKQTISTGGFVGAYSSPAIGDINGDGASDIVVGSYGHYLYAWSYTGADVPGYPIDTKDTIWSSPALADLDRDGLKEVIVGGDSTGGSGWPYPPGGLLWVFRGNGQMYPGFPKITPEVIWSSPAVADIDNDGWYEIVVGTGHYYTATGRLTTEGFRVYAWNHDSSDVPGWPVAVPGCTMSSPAIGDIDNDGNKEIGIACYPVAGRGGDYIILMRGNGQKLWEQPAFGGPNRGSPAFGDVNSDGKAEFILGSGIEWGAWDIYGNNVWHQVLDNMAITSPAVGDFDRDGRIECAVGTGGESGGGTFYVFDCGTKRDTGSGDAGILPWPQFRNVAQHTGAIPTGNEPPPPPPPANFHEYILMMNPGGTAAHVTLELMNEKAEKKNVEMTINPYSRSTAFINRYMPGCGVSARVTSDVPIISERSMYFNFQGKWKGGTDSAGASTASKTWYLAEGYTSGNFDEYVLVQNPQKSAVNVDMAFMREGQAPVYASFSIKPESRFTLNVKDVPGCQSASISTKIDASAPVICERSMYFNYNGFVGGHNSGGVTAPATRWYLAEGYTAQSYDTYVLVQNPGAETASVTLNLLRKDGYTQKVSFQLPAQSRKTVRLDDVPGFAAAEVSTDVTSNKGVIAERAMYFDAGGRTGGHDSAGASAPAPEWYLAEGYTGGQFDEYVLVMNPGDTPISVKTTFMPAKGSATSRMDTLKPHSRFTIHVDEQPGLDNAEVSTLVEAQDGKEVIAERAMYFVYNGVWAD
ncbi:MAG: FG-GAP repeat domain-containing protein, partial [Candidatus Geothermincolia bacterium]